jgi:hypothetical protein
MAATIFMPLTRTESPDLTAGALDKAALEG